MRNVFSFLVTLLIGQNVFAQEIRFDIEMLQRELNARMPLIQHHSALSLTLSNPHLRLLENKQRVSIRTQVDVVTVFGSESQGWISIDGKLRYQSSDFSFYVDDPKITTLQIDGLNPNLQPQLRSIAQDTLAPALAGKPLYTLNNDDMHEALARENLASIIITNDAIIAKLNHL